MGTSRGYRAPTGPGWPPLKNLVTQFGNGDSGGAPIPPLPPLPPDPLPPEPTPLPIEGPSAEQLLARYIATCGGAHAMVYPPATQAGGRRAGGGGGGGGDGGGGGPSVRPIGGAAARVGRDLGNFAGRVREVGLADTLREFDLGDLVGRSARAVFTGLINRLCGPGSTMDESLARAALNDLRRGLLGTAKTFEDVERILSGVLEGIAIEGIIVTFYGCYLYQMFRRDFYERLMQKVGKEKARRSCDRIEHTIKAKLQAKVARRDPTKLNWRGAEGQRLAEDILETTLRIFGAEA